MFGTKSENWLIVGLGNPGKEYEKTRHNAGFRAIDLLADELGCKIDKGKFQGLYGQCNYNGCKLFLLKPLTYMNDSGIAIREAAAFYKIPPERIIILVDDINLEPGKLRLRRKGSDGGQNGLKSIIANLGSDKFTRIRIGIGQKPHPAYELAAWVLSRFTESDRKAIDSSLDRVCDTVELLIAGKDDEAMRLCNSN